MATEAKTTPTEDGGAEVTITNTPDPVKGVGESLIDLDGESLTLDQVREFKKGYLRQEDYTKKTTEVAKQRDANTSFQGEIEEYKKFSEYLRNNPEVADKVMEVMSGKPSANDQRLSGLEKDFYKDKLENDMKAFKDTFGKEYPGFKFDDAKIYGYISRNNPREVNVEKAFYALYGKELSTHSAKTAKASLAEKIRSGEEAFIPDIGSKKSTTKTVTLNAEERQVARMLGLSEADYVEGMDKESTK